MRWTPRSISMSVDAAVNDVAVHGLKVCGWRRISTRALCYETAGPMPERIHFSPSAKASCRASRLKAMHFPKLESPCMRRTFPRKESLNRAKLWHLEVGPAYSALAQQTSYQSGNRKVCVGSLQVGRALSYRAGGERAEGSTKRSPRKKGGFPDTGFVAVARPLGAGLYWTNPEPRKPQVGVQENDSK